MGETRDRREKERKARHSLVIHHVEGELSQFAENVLPIEIPEGGDSTKMAKFVQEYRGRMLPQ